jgi:hypothetical protein
MDMGLSILFPLVVLLGFVSFVVVAVVYFRSEKEPEPLQRRFLLRFYAYAMLFISSLILLIGGGLLLKAALSYPLGMEFSYGGPPLSSGRARLRDLLNGVTFVGTGTLFLALHWALRNRVEGLDERRLSFLNKGYLMMSGVVYGGLSLALFPMGLYQLIEFYFFSWSRPVPGDVVGYALVALFLWLWILPQLFKSLGLEKGEE